ncbi:hypothetical protein ILUMI_17437, partial [Ignelater luminosus]
NHNRQFSDYTVITMAHKLHTIMDSENVLGERNKEWAREASILAKKEEKRAVTKAKAEHAYEKLGKTQSDSQLIRIAKERDKKESGNSVTRSGKNTEEAERALCKATEWKGPEGKMREGGDK